MKLATIPHLMFTFTGTPCQFEDRKNELLVRKQPASASSFSIPDKRVVQP